MYHSENPMVKSLTKTGNSVCLVIDQALLKMMDLTAGDDVKLRLDGQNLIISPVDKNDRTKFAAAMSKSDKRFAKAYKRLAE